MTTNSAHILSVKLRVLYSDLSQLNLTLLSMDLSFPHAFLGHHHSVLVFVQRAFQVLFLELEILKFRFCRHLVGVNVIEPDTVEL